MKTPAQIAAIFGCTPERARQQMQANAKQLANMAKRGERVNGYTRAELLAKAAALSKAAAL